MTEPDTDPLAQLFHAAELIRRRRITVVCPSGKASPVREALAAAVWAGLVDVVECEWLPDDDTMYVTRPWLFDGGPADA